MFANALNALLAALAIGLLILVHEIGHFLAAKAVGVRVEVFSIGFWKKIVSFKRGGTEYRLCVIPLGGYVRMAGELTGEGSGAPDEFSSKSPGQRATVFVAGVAMNMVLALVGFVLAFAVGVPFSVAQVGILQKGWPAWKAGMLEGDRIIEINGLKDPDLHDATRVVALDDDDIVVLTVEREGEPRHFEFASRYDEDIGLRRIGFQPPMETIVTTLFAVDGEGGTCPAKAAGIEVGDRIVAINGQPVRTYRELAEVMAQYPPGKVRVTVERGDEEHTLDVVTEPMPRYVIGIFCVSSEVESLQGDGFGQKAGLKVGDRIISVNGRGVGSILEVEQAIEGAYGPVELTVLREGQETTIRADVPDRRALNEFVFSVECKDGSELTWVQEDSPAWQAGMRRGDRLLEIDGTEVEGWKHIREVSEGAGKAPRRVTWQRGEQTLAATITPVNQPDESAGMFGCSFDLPHERFRQYGAWKSVKTGLYKTYGTVADIVLSVRGIARRDVSSRNLGSIIVIAQSSYLAAQEGIGKLLYLTAMISAALAFLNILPIPILDGGHLFFVAIEKLRGRPVSEKVMAISQYVGLGLLVALVFYAVANDVMRLIG